MSGAYETLSVTRDGSIVTIELQRPDKLNAQTQEMWFELRQVGDALGGDTSIRALVLAGAGRAFCAGLDTSILAAGLRGGEMPEDVVGLDGPELVRRIQESFTWLNDAPYPTIAAVHSYALGAGCQLALACDLRVAADDAVFALAELNWGLMPDLGGTVWLPQLVGPAVAKELMWLADRVDAHRALALGMVNRVVPAESLRDEAVALAQRLAARPPLAVTAVKRAVQATMTYQDDALAVAGEGQLRCLASNDLVEAGTAHLEGREPSYTGT